MPVTFDKRFVVAVSSRALFDLAMENRLFQTRGIEAFERYQLRCQDKVLKPGPAFPLVRSLLSLNQHLSATEHIEVVVISRNSTSAGLRVRNSIEHHKLPITRLAFTSGGDITRYLGPFNVGLFLTADPSDVAKVWNVGFPAAQVWGLHASSGKNCESEVVRIAFDGDGVLFSDESERIYQDLGLETFLKHEAENASIPLDPGPMARVFKSLSELKRALGTNANRVRTYLITARNSPADKRVINTFRRWGIEPDETVFLGGLSKQAILKELSPHIFFDDQPAHCGPAHVFVPTAQVPSNLFTALGVLPPNCPRCGEITKLREATRGDTAGKAFYGCSKFPHCHGSVSIA